MFDFRASDETKRYMKDGIRYVCENFQKRLAGSKSERKAQEYFKSELEKYADDVKALDFTLHPKAFMNFIIIPVSLCFVSIAMFWLFPSYIYPGSTKAELAATIIPPVLMLLGILMVLFEFLFYGEFVDFLFPKKTSCNLYAVRKPTGAAKRRIIFAGHADASNERNFSSRGRLKFFAFAAGFSVVGMFFIFIVTLARLFSALRLGFVPEIVTGIWKPCGIIMLLFVPFLLLMCFFINRKAVTDGASSLSASFVAIGVLKELADNDFRFSDTEVGCLITGGSEAGLRGAKAFAKKQRQEFKDTETVVITLDNLCELDQLQIYTRGCNGTIKDSEAAGNLLFESGTNNKVQMKRAPLYLGAVDAEAFSKYDIRACGLCGVDRNNPKNCRSSEDTFSNISEECINLSLDICLEAAKLYNSKGGIKIYEKNLTKK